MSSLIARVRRARVALPSPRAEPLTLASSSSPSRASLARASIPSSRASSRASVPSSSSVLALARRTARADASAAGRRTRAPVRRRVGPSVDARRDASGSGAAVRVGAIRYVDMRVFYRILIDFMTIQLVTIRALATAIGAGTAPSDVRRRHAPRVHWRVDTARRERTPRPDERGRTGERADKCARSSPRSGTRRGRRAARARRRRRRRARGERWRPRRDGDAR